MSTVEICDGSMKPVASQPVYLKKNLLAIFFCKRHINMAAVGGADVRSNGEKKSTSFGYKN